jgi:hypothetical protein
MLDKLRSSDFRPYLDQAFCIRLAGSEPIALALTSVTELGQAGTPAARRPFSLIFTGPVSRYYLNQHIYTLEHEQMGRIDLFVVPIGPEAGRMRYEAILS